MRRLALLLLAAPLGAQQQLNPVRVSASETFARAEALHEHGAREGETLSRLKRAAKLHQQSAELRAADDPRRAECLREAALLRGPAGWGEFAPFLEYGDAEAARWLAAALEAATLPWPAPVRSR